MNATGSALAYCGYVGGAGRDIGTCLAVDAAGAVHFGGHTNSQTGFPKRVGPALTHKSGALDSAFVGKLDTAGKTLIYLGYLSGSSTDIIADLEIDRAGHAYVAGWTSSTQTSFPVKTGPVLTQGGGIDGFVAKVAPGGGSLLYCGYLGGFRDDICRGIALDPAGGAYLTGHAFSPNFPVVGGLGLVHGGNADAYLAKVDASGALDHVGFIGGSVRDVGWGIALDFSGAIYIAGEAGSSEASFPLVRGPFLRHAGGTADAFVAKVHYSPGKNHLYSLYGDPQFSDSGYSVGGANDVDRDGHPDIVVGTNGQDVVRIYSGKNGTVLRTLNGNQAGDRFGEAVRGAGDIDADGNAEIIIGAPNGLHNGQRPGVAYVVSGKTATTLYRFTGASNGSGFGQSVDGAGDVNKDGTLDLIVGAPYQSNAGPASGSVYVLSGKNGSTLYTFDGDSGGDLFGWSVTGVGDVNNDGFDDVAVGTPQDDNSGADSGSVRVLSGKNRAVLYTFNGDARGDRLGQAVRYAGDVNNDGYPDIIAGAPFDDNNGSNSGSARIYSGKDGKTIHTLDGPRSSALFGSSVDAVGDYNGDGFDDVIVGGPDHWINSARTGVVQVFSGKDGSVLATFVGDTDNGQFGYSVAGPGDVDGDGHVDCVVGSWSRMRHGSPGLALVLSSKPLSLVADNHVLSVAGPGVLTFYLDAGMSNAARNYLLVGSISGTSPGIPLGPFTVPLNFDPYFQFTATTPNLAPLTNSAGKLDMDGRGRAYFTVNPAAFGPLVGFTVHHAYGAFGTTIDHVSNAVSLTFVP